MDANDTQQARTGSRAPLRGPTSRSALPDRAAPAAGSREDRVIGGVCGGLGRYFNVDPILFRIGGGGADFVGGAGLLLYLAGLLLIPSEPATPGAEPPRGGRSGPSCRRGGAARRRLALSTRRRPHRCSRSRPHLGPRYRGCSRMVARLGRRTERRAARHRAASGARSRRPHPVARGRLGGAIAAAAGGETVVAGVLIVAGLAIAAGAFVRPVRWLILPAVLLALSAGSVAAADVDARRRGGRPPLPARLDGDLRDHYELGVGSAGHRPARPRPAARATRRSRSTWASAMCGWPCPTDVCVATEADVGVGEANVLGRANAGVDVS